jgi:ABC-type polysaccharide/polyol phosphate transport system ATPase subunit
MKAGLGIVTQDRAVDPIEPLVVPAHDDLVIDEVPAVGDASFQKKCLGKMSDIVKTGRTIVFVSHNITVVRRLASGAIWLRSPI